MEFIAPQSQLLEGNPNHGLTENVTQRKKLLTDSNTRVTDKKRHP